MTSQSRAASVKWGADWPFVLAVWLLVLAAMLYGYSIQISELRLSDPDDALRLVQVRDFLAGQAWHDLTQYRINVAGGGGKLHWSRFIDAQIAGLILLLQLFLPAVEAERWALALYPPLLILPLLFIFQRLLAHLGDRMFVNTGLLVAATTFSFLHYFTPLRIDHHNWQLLLSVTMLWLALGPATFARGLAAALVISMHVEISLEGLPYLLIFGGLFAFDWLRDPRTGPRLAGFAMGLIGIPMLWVLALRGGDAVTGVYCDAFSRPYLAGAMITGLILSGCMAQTRFPLGMWGRIVALTLAGAAGGIAFILAGPACLAGPFGNLSPLVHKFWYVGISEGHPIWHQPPMILISFTLPSIFGLAGLVWHTRRLAGTDVATNWQRLTIVALCSFGLSLLVLRTTAVTHAYVVAGYVPAVLAIFYWGRSFSSAIARIPATAACILALPLTVSAVSVGVLTEIAPESEGGMPTDCLTPAAVAKLRALPPGTAFASLDIASGILAGTRHDVVATGHHRNHRAMHRILAAFLGTSATAEKLMRQSAADYVILCKNLPEYENFLKYAPNGFTASLDQGRPPNWLAADPAHSLGAMIVYRVRPITPP